MPQYTLGEIMSHATANVGRRADIEGSRVSFMVNEAYMEVAIGAPAALSEKSTELSASSGTASVALPDDFHEPIILSHTSWAGDAGRNLKPVTVSQIASSETSSSGIPDSFAFFGTDLILDPRPNSDYTLLLRYRALPEDMLSVNSVPELHKPWRRAVMLNAQVKLLEFLGDYEAAAIAQQRYLSYTAQLKSDAARRQSGEYPRGMRYAWENPFA